MVERLKANWVKFGRELRHWRLHAGLSQGQLGKRLSMTHAMISAIERGTRGAKPEYVAQFDRILSTNGALSRLWETLHKKGGYPTWLQDIVDFEQKATEIWEYHPVLVPGLLQTPGYTRALALAGRPSRTPEEVDEIVEGRRLRQEILIEQRRPSPRLLAVLDETVIRRPVGGASVMKEQLKHLLEVSDSPRMTIQIVPFSTEQHPGLTGSFRLLRTDDGSNVLYLEHAQSGIVIDDLAEIQEFSERYADLRGVALPPSESRRLINEVRGELR
ncbi:helix-turn-helix domain-containing protein [Nocardiopsis sp. CNT-189]|uniref:helix-turn-helix domain-containing protein n=1 Tax=Nocardiopsis oceanisediminis TaxID=2816862 RepID=UPI003B32119D